MQKNYRKIIFIILSAFFLIIYLGYDEIKAYFGKDIMETAVLSEEEIDSLCEGREDAFLEPDITFNGGKLAYDIDQNMLLIPQSLGEEGFTGKLKAAEGELYFLEDEAFADKAEAIRQNKVFRLFWIKDAECWMYNVYFTGMPVINLQTAAQGEEEKEEREEDEEEGEEKEEGDDEELWSGNVWVYDPYHSAAQYQSSECTWRIRGATTRYYEKKSYKLTLTDNKLSFLGMRKDDDWILHGLYDDDGLIHNKLSYEVWQEIAADNDVKGDEGISMEYAELFVDGTYLGVYGLSERIDKKALSLDEKDILYKCRDQDNPGEDDFYSELTEEMNPAFEWKYPEDFETEDWEPLKRWTEMYCFDGLTDYEEGKAILNMENAVDYNLFNLLTCGMDNIMKNIYYWADYQSDGSYRFIKIPWDLNMTWGNSWIDDYNCNYNRYQEKNLESTDGWTNDMYLLYEQNPEEIGSLLKKRWQELRESIIIKEALYEKVDAQYEYLYASGAYDRNRQKWPPKGDYWSDGYIYEYIDKRIDFLDSYIGQME